MERKLYNLSLFIFRRDLRLYDNTALINASKNSNKIIPVFFLDERQIDISKNKYFSSNCVQFMLESICDLNKHLNDKQSTLRLFYGNINKNLENLIKNEKIEAIYLNEDYTPFSIKRDNDIKDLCKNNNINFHSFEDLMLTNLKQVMLPKGEFFKVYTPYCQEAIKHEINKPNNYNIDNLTKNNTKLENEIVNYNIDILLEKIGINYNKDVEIKGGRTSGLNIVNNMVSFKDYANTRQFVKISSTRLSAYLKFGCVSVREVYESIVKTHGGNLELIKQLHWRDFFMKITYFYPHVIGNSFKNECDHIVWQAKSDHIEAWKKGFTGFPIVDSAMRCLNKTGFIHNKLRTMVCSFLVKDILADWRIGENYFANQLVDYDISLNNGGWQWTASTGTDPRGEPRIYNPVLQSEKLDPNCDFIYKWLPELKGVKPIHIHNWEKYSNLYEGNVDYPSPIFSHYEQRDKAMKMFTECKYFKKNYTNINRPVSNLSYNKSSFKNFSTKIEDNEYVKEIDNYNYNNKNSKKEYKNKNSNSIMNMVYGFKNNPNNSYYK